MVIPQKYQARPESALRVRSNLVLDVEFRLQGYTSWQEGTSIWSAPGLLEDSNDSDSPTFRSQIYGGDARLLLGSKCFELVDVLYEDVHVERCSSRKYQDSWPMHVFRCLRCLYHPTQSELLRPASTAYHSTFF